jgi:signal transduction histidine kinase
MNEKVIKVLLIEDNKGDVRLIQEMLKESTYMDFAFYTLDSLHDINSIEGQVFDIVLLDLHFDDITGLESYKLANAYFPMTPIIVLTGLADEKLAYETVKLGAQDYILKDDVDSKGLVRSIRYAIERKRAETHKDDFLGFASHELKTPVTSIKAYVQLMELYATKESKDPASSLLPFIKKVDTQVDKLTNFINDLLDVTKVQAGKMEFNFENFLIDEIVDEVIDTMQLTTSRHSINKNGASKAFVYGDKERTSQVLVNLLSNAIKYSPHADKINVTVANGGDTVSVAVQDFGLGISQKNQEKVFDRFYRVDGKRKETFPGLGLGLYIASEIIKRQNGRLYVKSEEGSGSTFCVELPVITHNKKTPYEEK